ncbi:MAG: hypothetical protein N2490_06950 [Ignavibacteria bacterium]|nr:hypothetical protein [Ignavibacteria bacterium]
MKKILLFIFIFLFSLSGFSQDEIKSSGSGGYGGVGLSLVFFTQQDVWNIYPILDVSNTSFVTEVTPYLGYKFNRTFALEFAPGILINRSYSKNGFYFTSKTLNIKQYYIPQNVTLVAIPLNARGKVYPFAKKAMVNEFVSGLYFGTGFGVMFVGESYDNYIYADENSQTPLGTVVSKKNQWAFNSQFFVGYEFQSRFGLGIELGYRIVPLEPEWKAAVVSDFSPNMNYFYINLKGGLGF